MSVYPSHQDVDAVLRDGSTVRIRPVVREDRDTLKSFLEGLSEQSRIFRFFGPVKELGWAADRLTDLDYRTAHGLVALRGSEAEILGHGSYQATRDSRAEIALEVGDSMQGQGLGTILRDHLAQPARKRASRSSRPR